MKVFSIPQDVKSLLFDIDNTLYSDDGYYQLQIELLLRRFAEQKKISPADAREMFEAEKKRYAAENGGKKTSTGNIMQAFGISLEENARWRDELFKPEDFLSEDGGTVAVFKRLVSSYSIAAVTNNTVGIGRRTLAVLGLADLIPVIVGLDTCFVSKPAEEPFEAALQILGCSPHNAVSVGDRYDVDLEIPLAMGMGGVLIENLSDLYALPEILLPS